MSTFFLLLFLALLIATIIGIIKPKAVIKWGAIEKRTRLRVLLYYGLAIFVCLILVGVTAPEQSPEVKAAMAQEREAKEIAKAEERTKKEAEKKAEADEKAKAEEEARASAEKEARVKAEKAEEEVRVAAEKEAKAKEEEEARLLAEQLAKTPHLGEAALVGSLTVGLDDSIEVSNQVGDNYLNVKSNGEFWIIEVGVRNDDKESRTIDASMFTLVGPGGITYDADSTAGMYINSNGTGFFLESINPGIQVNGYIVFDMPPELRSDIGQFKLRVSSGVLFAGTKNVDFILKVRE